MFGGVAAKVNGHLFAGLFGRSAMVHLSDADRAAALALDGAALFDPMGNGRARSDKIMLPEDVFHDPDELRHWIGRAFEFTATLPRKTRTEKPSAATKRPAASKSAAARSAANKPAAARSAVSKSAAGKPAAKRSTAATAARADRRR